MSKYCKNCGFPIFEKDEYCENCGKSIKDKVDKPESQVENTSLKDNEEFSFAINDKQVEFLVETAKNIQQLQEIIESKYNERTFIKAKLWTETDFKEILHKKQPTINDKELFIESKSEINELNNEISAYESKLDYYNKLYEIFFNERYNK
jgi:uncharacterized Zn finger protein (UPF0148 family)